MTINKVGTCKSYIGLLLVTRLLCLTNAKELGPSVGDNGMKEPLQAFLSDNRTSSDSNETDSLARGKDLVDEALIPVYDMTNFFLEDIVQQNDLNYMAEKGVDFSDLDAIVDSFEDDYEEWIEYGIGYSVCAAIGVVLLVFMTLAGMFICCCRTCCGNCGGKIDPRESSSAGCKRACCGFFLFIVITVVLLGSLAMFFTAARVHDELYSDEDVFHSIADGMDIMGKYVNNTMDELENGTLGVYNETVDKVFHILDNVVTKSYKSLDNTTGITKNMDDLLEFTGQIDTLNDTLTEVQINAAELQVNVTQLDGDLEDLKMNITTAISSSCGAKDVCINMIYRVENTSVDANYTNITSGYNYLIGVLHFAHENDINDLLVAGYNNFTSIVEEVNNTVSEEIDVAREAADEVAGDIQKELDNVEEDVGGVDFAGVGTDMREISEDHMETPALITFWTLVGFASVLALIVLLTYLGLLFSCCPRANKEDDYCCTKKVGATCLLAGVGFTFIFYWIFLLVLIPMFLTGGLTQTEICRHIVALDESPISGIIDELLNATFYEDTGFSINITEMYTSCKADLAFYTALDAENTFGFNLTEMLDTTAIDQEIAKITNVNVTIGTIEILSNSTAWLLYYLGEELGHAAADTKVYLADLEKNVTSENLKELAADLKELAKNEALRGLASLARDLEDLYDNSVVPIDDQRMATHAQLDAALPALNTDIIAITDGLIEGQNITNNEGEDIIEKVIDDTAYEAETIIDDAVATIEKNVRTEIGKCKPVYNAVATITDSACVELLYAVNGYWFALGWSIFFLLISVILSFKLSTMNRKTMDHDEILPEERRGGRAPPRHQRHSSTDSNVTIVRTNSHEMMPVNNPVYTVDDQYYHRIPRPQLNQGVAVYPQGRPPSYSESQFRKK